MRRHIIYVFFILKDDLAIVEVKSTLNKFKVQYEEDFELNYGKYFITNGLHRPTHKK